MATKRATKKAPWKKSNPTQKHKSLTPKEKTTAKARAKKAGRPYPNLVDNMNAAKAKKPKAKAKAKPKAKAKAKAKKKS